MTDSKDQKSLQALSNPSPDTEESAPPYEASTPSSAPPPPTYTAPTPRASTRSKVVDKLAKPFAPFLHSHDKKKEAERSPALQEAIDRMEARKAVTIRKMEEEGKDTSTLSGKRIDQVRNPMRGVWEGAGPANPI